MVTDGVGAGVVGVAVGELEQVQVGDGVAVEVSVFVAVTVGVGLPPPGCSPARAECDANNTVKLEATSVMLASPAILARFLVVKVTRCLLAAGNGHGQTVRSPGCSCCHRAITLRCPTFGAPGRNAIERQTWYNLVGFVVMR